MKNQTVATWIVISTVATWVFSLAESFELSGVAIISLSIFACIAAHRLNNIN